MNGCIASQKHSDLEFDSVLIMYINTGQKYLLFTIMYISAGSHKNHAKLKIHSTSRLTDFDEIYFI